MDLSNPNEVWNETLGELQLQLTKATFDAWVRNTRAIAIGNGSITISVNSPYAKEWLENRLSTTIKRTLTGVLGGAIEINYVVPDYAQQSALENERRAIEQMTPAQKKALVTSSTTPQAELSAVQSELPEPTRDTPLDVEGAYGNDANALLQPDRIAVMTQYFRKKWVPILGANLAFIIIDLRQRAYWNRISGERRDTFLCTNDDIARMIGVTTETVINLVKKKCTVCAKDDHTLASHFIILRKPIYEKSSLTGKMICKGVRYRVRLDDPLIPADEKALSEKRNT